MYNFGFAQSHSLPKISDGLMGMIDFNICIQAGGKKEQFKGKVIGFSSRLNTILVPQAFMDWSNQEFAPNQKSDPTRLIVEVGNPGDENITKYLDDNGYEVETDKLDAEKTTYFLRMMVSMVMIIGLGDFRSEFLYPDAQHLSPGTEELFQVGESALDRLQSGQCSEAIPGAHHLSEHRGSGHRLDHPLLPARILHGFHRGTLPRHRRGNDASSHSLRLCSLPGSFGFEYSSHPSQGNEHLAAKGVAATPQKKL